jgi:hypothetical protein|uniref:Uncharacterized protein n=1 Tax=Phaeodactylum tricornutum TaxID=2850 RepID=A0A8J9T8Y1_PHATR
MTAQLAQPISSRLSVTETATDPVVTAAEAEATVAASHSERRWSEDSTSSSSSSSSLQPALKSCLSSTNLSSLAPLKMKRNVSFHAIEIRTYVPDSASTTGRKSPLPTEPDRRLSIDDYEAGVRPGVSLPQSSSRGQQRATIVNKNNNNATPAWLEKAGRRFKKLLGGGRKPRNKASKKENIPPSVSQPQRYDVSKRPVLEDCTTSSLRKVQSLTDLDQLEWESDSSTSDEESGDNSSRSITASNSSTTSTESPPSSPLSSAKRAKSRFGTNEERSKGLAATTPSTLSSATAPLNHSLPRVSSASCNDLTSLVSQHQYPSTILEEFPSSNSLASLVETKTPISPAKVESQSLLQNESPVTSMSNLVSPANDPAWALNFTNDDSDSQSEDSALCF